MGLLQAFKMAIKSILSNKVRSFLTMLGVIIGVGSVIAAVAFAQGSTAKVTSSLQKLGTNLIQVTINGRGSNRNVTYDDLLELAAKSDSGISYIAPNVSGSVTVKYGDASLSTTLNGTSPEYENIKDVHVQSGRFILSFDDKYMQKVALIGTYVAQQVFGETDPVGQKMKINGQIFKVVGVLAQKDGGEKSSGDDVVIIPYTVAQRLSKSARITSYLVGASSATDVDKATTNLKTYLAKIFTDDTRGYSVRSQEQMLSTLSDVTGSMMVILGGIAAISLVVGGIGIMNIMLVSVTERTREIGIRKAIGAKRRSILIQFLIESAVVTGIGGILGVLIGVGIIYFIIGGFNITTPVYSPFWMILSFGISLAVGVVFGMFPAYKAARLNPIEALRSE